MASQEQPFATQSDRIKALCDEAMRKPEISVTEKTLDRPAARLSTETSRLKVAAMKEAVAAAETAPAVDATDAPAKAFGTTPEAKPKVVQHHVEQDQELAAMLEERDGRLKKKKGRVKLVANVMLLALIVAPVTAVAVNPSLKGKFEKFVGHLGEGVDDVKTMANTKESFDEALAEVATRGDHITIPPPRCSASIPTASRKTTIWR